MQAYFFGNMYLSSIQQGIQAAHAVSDMFVKYLNDESYQRNTLTHWAKDHKTMILCNAGYSAEIRNLIELFCDERNKYPFAYFRESNEALDEALTTVGIILPHWVYDRKHIVAVDANGVVLVEEWVENVFHWTNFSHCEHRAPGESVFSLTPYDVQLMLRIGQYSLAK